MIQETTSFYNTSIKQFENSTENRYCSSVSSAVGTANRLRAVKSGVRIQVGTRDFLFCRMFRLALEPGYRGKSGRSVKLTIHLHPVPRLGMSGAMPTWRGQGKIYLHLCQLLLLHHTRSRYTAIKLYAL